MPAMDGDLVLLERWRAGDQRAGQDLFGRHFAGIYRFFEHKVGAEADELAQATFLACLAAREQFRGHSSFRTYLFVIARHELYAHLRRKRHDDAIDFEITSIAAIVTTPGTRLDRGRHAEQLRAALLELPADQQILLELHYWHELDAAALGDVFDASASTIRVRLVRARAALRDRLARLGYALPTAGRDRLAASLVQDDAVDHAL
jgi:RNA polymerase sigma factor (sigma-70 family)